MKLEYFYGSVIIRERDGYSEPLSFSSDKSGKLIFRYPYGDATPEEAEAVSQFVKTVTNAYNKLTAQIDNVNKDLKLEQYAPIVLAEETSAETEPESASPQSCALGDGEVSTEIQDAPFEDPEHPFGLSEEQIAVLKANKGTTEEDIFGE